MINYDLDRFLVAQESDYTKARAEIAAGQKTTHWIWYVYPQLAGLGRSERSEYYGIDGIGEAEAYLRHPVLGDRLTEMFKLLLNHEGTAPETILGSIDAAKVRSSATLFEQVDGAPKVFGSVLEAFYDGERDKRTLELL